LSGLRFVGGVTTAVTFVLGSALAARAHTGGSQRRSAALVAVYMTGVGLGIVVSGVVVPAVLRTGGPAAWGTGWLIMGVLAALLVAPAAWAVRQVPEQAATTFGTASIKLRRLTPLFVWYVLFGAGYVSYMTFVIALLREQQVSDGQVAVFFVVLGLASIIATLTVWGRVIARLPRGRAPSIISVIVAAGVLPVVLMDGFTAALVSAVVFGSSFMAGPTAATVLARRMLPARGWTTGIASLTVAFSIGQAVGPLLAGALSDLNGGIELGLWLSVVLLAVAGLVALTQRDIKVSLVTEAVAGTTR
jgi:predicted MFS family arabinose efflux permease